MPTITDDELWQIIIGRFAFSFPRLDVLNRGAEGHAHDAYHRASMWGKAAYK
ncbi:MAG TPA: hypothetical protein VM223_28360 [Planctomycetota bacterium]|nr:hypothetical protein [Planctomycetota bacterium]